MKYSLLYHRETSNLLRYYANRDSPVKRYIQVCQAYIGEMESNTIEEVDYVYLFNEVLSYVDETYRPDHFMGIRGQIRVFSTEFIEYFLSRSSELKRRILWDQLCSLYMNYDLWRIAWLIKTGFTAEFREYAEKNISLKMLWKYADPPQEVPKRKIVGFYKNNLLIPCLYE